MTQVPGGWAFSTKTVLSILGSIIFIVSSIGGVIGWGIGLYNSVDKRFAVQDRRIAVAEANTSRMSDDIKDIKLMFNQLLLNRTENRPEMRKWSK